MQFFMSHIDCCYFVELLWVDCTIQFNFDKAIALGSEENITDVIALEKGYSINDV